MNKKYVVIKCGGSVLEKLPHSFYQNVVDLQKQGEWQPIIVHGGGPLISKLLKQTGVPTTFVNGLRVTTQEVLDVVEMALSGSINKQIVRKLVEAEGKAFGISGIDGGLLTAKPVDNKEDMGFVGEVTNVNTMIIKDLVEKGFIPIISPIGIDESGERFNINADMAASAVAQSLGAKLCYISDIPGIYEEKNGQKHIFHQLDQVKANQLIDLGVIAGGMIPKVQSAIKALHQHVLEVSIIDGIEPDGLWQFMQGKEIGTRILLNKEGKSHV
ncbi:acetylglutamate kinase [Gracilibacillus dipsosauri]|uniref:Acetylglutamate kinase n=1 Tax=Gracilibacillus dipsosauri TaxID=178340 RepID=A0A317L1G2_9BACI|nr:acetylglutamate kinase [Gracilibacillus dipsosauri]PWU69677.1 acetylglutamate kinase [Gracilibacillus dipsosauri]